MVAAWGFSDPQTSEAYLRKAKKYQKLHKRANNRDKDKDPEIRLARFRKVANQPAPPGVDIHARQKRSKRRVAYNWANGEIEPPSPGVSSDADDSLALQSVNSEDQPLQEFATDPLRGVGAGPMSRSTDVDLPHVEMVDPAVAREQALREFQMQALPPLVVGSGAGRTRRAGRKKRS